MQRSVGQAGLSGPGRRGRECRRELGSSSAVSITSSWKQSPRGGGVTGSDAKASTGQWLVRGRGRGGQRSQEPRAGAQV